MGMNQWGSSPAELGHSADDIVDADELGELFIEYVDDWEAREAHMYAISTKPLADEQEGEWDPETRTEPNFQRLNWGAEGSDSVTSDDEADGTESPPDYSVLD
jgi:hypothetical protein